MLGTIIGCSVLAFIVAVLVIYFKDIKNYIKGKLTFKKKQTPKEVVEEKPSADQPEPVKVYTPEDFMPKSSGEDPVRDASLEELFSGDMDEFGFEMEASEMLDQSESIDKKVEEILGKKLNNKPKQTISETIKNLPPEIKAMLLDNTLKKRDDV